LPTALIIVSATRIATAATGPLFFVLDVNMYCCSFAAWAAANAVPQGTRFMKFSDLSSLSLEKMVAVD
jgi:hypothetical protein